MAHPHAHARSHHVEKAHGLIHRTGNHAVKHRARGGALHEDAAEDAHMIERGVHEHESAMHKGEPKTKLKLKHGGHVDGEHARHHLAKRARGGATGGGKKGHATKVNVIVAPQGGGGARPVPVPVPAARPPGVGGAPPPMPPPGMGAPSPMGGAPMGAGPMGPRPGMPGPMMRARGGHVPHMEAGAMSGPGRIEKTHEYGVGGFKPKKRMIHKG